MTRVGVIFSDIDGTLVHYAAKLRHQGYELREQPPGSGSGTSGGADRAVFVHAATGAEIPALAVPSATLGGGYISERTLALARELRTTHGVRLCLLTGARTSTFLKRCESGTLPDFDFGVCEGGGKIYVPRRAGAAGGDAGAACLDIDAAWIDSHRAAIGPWRDNQSLPCGQREGVLWDLYRLLERAGNSARRGGGGGGGDGDDDASGGGGAAAAQVLGAGVVPKLDADSFDSAFMVDVRPDAAAKDNTTASLGVTSVSDVEHRLRALVAERFPALTMVVNLGKGHVSARGCTKADVVEYLAATKLRVPLRATAAGGPPSGGNGSVLLTAALFDDENDLEFAKMCHIGFAPGVAHPAVGEFLKQASDEAAAAAAVAVGGSPAAPRYRKCPHEGFLGTEYALEQLLAMCAAA